MSYRWLDCYYSDSEVIETAPGVFKIMLKNPKNAGDGYLKKYPMFGISKDHVSDAIAKSEEKLRKLREISNKMNEVTNEP